MAGLCALAALALVAGGCALVGAAPPQVQVAAVQLQGVTLLEQSLAVTLCVTNPNDAALDFRRVSVAVDVAGSPLVAGESVLSVQLPPHATVLVPFAVTTTIGNLGPQLLAVLQAGSVAYRIHGTVQLTGLLPITLPYSRAGRLDASAIGQALLLDTQAPGTATCRLGGA